jgi:hypothetical protein
MINELFSMLVGAKGTLRAVQEVIEDGDPEDEGKCMHSL